MWGRPTLQGSLIVPQPTVYQGCNVRARVSMIYLTAVFLAGHLHRPCIAAVVIQLVVGKA